MNIKEFQLAKSISRAKKLLLKKGKAPTSSEVLSLSMKRFEKAGLGYPTFTPQYGERYEVSDKSIFNKMLTEIHDDISDLYDADSYLNNEVLSLFNYYDSEKKNTINSLNKLQRKLDGILYAMEDSSVKGSITDSFDDFLNVDFAGDSDKNIFETDAYINLLSKYASNDILSAYKINLSSAKVKLEIDSSFTKSQELSPISNCLNDNASETWIQKIVSDQANNLSSRLTIELDKQEVANSLRITLSSPKKLIVYAILHDEAGNTKELPKIESYDECEWSFRNTDIKKFVIVITKTEPDDTEATNYEYYIGAKNIALCKNIYTTQSIFVSKSYDIPSPFSQLYLNCDATIPQSTKLRYFIGIEKADRSVNWIATRNDQVNELNLLSTSVEVISYGTLGYGSSYNKNLFILSELSHVPVNKSLSLDVGSSMWSVKEIPYTTDTNLKDIYNQRTSRFINTDTIRFDIPKKTIQMISINAYCESSLEIASNIETPTGVRKYVFVNGMTIQSTRALMSNGRLNIRLSVGWNTINIITINENETDQRYIFDAYFKDKSVITVGELNSKEIDMYDMINSTPANSFNSYAIVDNKIIVNYNPQDIGLLCKAKYCYDTSNIFDDARLRFMCVMNSDTDELTPKLHSYQITMISSTQSPTSTDGGSLDGMLSVTYLDWNGAVLRVDYVPEGFASTPPKDPIRYGFTFTGWDSDVSDVRENMIVTALYKQIAYIVIFKNWNGDILSTQYIEHGDDAIEPPIPKYDNGRLNVQFFDKNNNQIAMTQVEAGGTVTPPTPPDVKDHKFKEWRETTYTGPTSAMPLTFLRWSESFKNVQSDLVIYAIFGDKPVVIAHEYQFLDHDDSVIQIGTVDDNNNITPPKDPVREGYDFMGWDVVGVPKIYTVDFYTNDNNLLESKKVTEGDTVAPPTPPSVTGFKFKEWKEK